MTAYTITSFAAGTDAYYMNSSGQIAGALYDGTN